MLHRSLHNISSRLSESVARLQFFPKTLILTWNESPIGVLILVIANIISAIIPLAIALVGKALVDQLISIVGGVQLHDHTSIKTGYFVHWLLVAEAVLIIVMLGTERVAVTIRQSLSMKLGTSINLLIIAKTMRLPILQLENSEFHDKLMRARREASSRPLSLLTDTFLIIRNLTTLTAFTLTLLNFQPFAAIILLAASTPGFLFEMLHNQKIYQLRRERAVDLRHQGYIEYLFSDNRHLREIRLLRMANDLISKYKIRAYTILKDENRLQVRQCIISTASNFSTTLVLYIVAANIVNGTLTGTLSVGEMLFYITAAKSCQSGSQGLLSALISAHSNNLYISNLFEFLNTCEYKADTNSNFMNSASFRSDNRLSKSNNYVGLSLERVWFRYRHDREWLFCNFDLRIPMGQKLAIVGANGSGKSTIAKLISGIYNPERGQICLTDKNGTSHVVEHPSPRVAMHSQEFARFQMTLAENIGCGHVERIASNEIINSAFNEFGYHRSPKSRDINANTQLGHLFPDGTELSGGEWQRVALARTHFNNDAAVYIFDEPTAALDTATEAKFIETVRSMAKDRIVIVITHRIAIAKIMDRIIVVDKGRIVQDGEHSTLHSCSGLYQSMHEAELNQY